MSQQVEFTEQSSLLLPLQMVAKDICRKDWMLSMMMQRAEFGCHGDVSKHIIDRQTITVPWRRYPENYTHRTVEYSGSLDPIRSSLELTLRELRHDFLFGQNGLLDLKDHYCNLDYSVNTRVPRQCEAPSVLDAIFKSMKLSCEDPDIAVVHPKHADNTAYYNCNVIAVDGWPEDLVACFPKWMVKFRFLTDDLLWAAFSTGTYSPKFTIRYTIYCTWLFIHPAWCTFVRLV